MVLQGAFVWVQDPVYHDGRGLYPVGGGQHFLLADLVQHGLGSFDGLGVGSGGTRGVVWEVDNDR